MCIIEKPTGKDLRSEPVTGLLGRDLGEARAERP